MNLRQIEDAGQRFYENKGRAGEERDEPRFSACYVCEYEFDCWRCEPDNYNDSPPEFDEVAA